MVGEDTAEEELPGSFNAAPVWARISVVAAGPVFNFILAFILSVIIVGFVGYDPAEIMDVQKDSAAETAGLKPEMLLQSTMDIMWTWRRICMFTAI